MSQRRRPRHVLRVYACAHANAQRWVAEAPVTLNKTMRWVNTENYEDALKAEE
jgi:hypothetical protein